jgi:hypothetical protein
MADPRDWDKQMAEIDRLMAKSGPPATPAPMGAPAPVPSAPAAVRREAPAAVASSAAPAMTRGGLLGLWALALMGPLGAASLAIWPYPKGCGTMLAVYLVGVAAVVGAGIWTMRASWVARRGLPHLLGLATALTWGCTI